MDDGFCRAGILFPLPLDRPFDYLLPVADSPPRPGSFVRASFGPRERTGIVWAVPSPDGPSCSGGSVLKTARYIPDLPALTEDVMDFVRWTAAYVMAPAGSVLAMVIRSGAGLSRSGRKTTGYVRAGKFSGRLTPQRRAVLDAAGSVPLPAGVLAGNAGVGEGVVRGLARAGGLETAGIDPDPPFGLPDPFRRGRVPDAGQKSAVETIGRLTGRPGGRTVLVDGVTGSGKTYVYLEAVASVLQADRDAQVLVLMPEIALTLPFLKRIEERFGAAPAGWHSGMTPAARRRTWKHVLEGQARIVVGARSALFLPFRNLKLVVVDEEHDSSYKQENKIRYHARDMAVARGARGGFSVLLVTATPSLETVVNVDEGRYAAVGLPARVAGAAIPEISLVDMRRDPPASGEWISPVLAAAVRDTLAAKEQILLFLNRRGYAPLTVCRRCGHRMTAPDSDTMLVEHRRENRLVCHHTGFSIPKPSACPACGAAGALVPCGPGVERIADEARRRWPDASVDILSSDTAGTPGAVHPVLEAMETGRTDILVATQAAAKGHHFPDLTLVGVIDADLGLSGGDLRAGERTWQLLGQVSGRAGRGKRPGRALLQTYRPGSAVFRALAEGDRDAFLMAEAAGRHALRYPPYGRLAALILRSRDEPVLFDTASALAAAAPAGKGIEVLGPAKAPLYRLRGELRMRFLVKAGRKIRIQSYIRDWMNRVRIPSPVRLVIDIDPYSFL